MTDIAMRRLGTHLVPVDPISEDEVKLLPLDKDVLVTAKTPRSVKQHRLAWALADKIAEACDFLHDREDAMSWLKIKARHVKILQDPISGKVAIIPKSISFASVNQQQFKRILDRMIFVTCSEIVPGLDEGKLRTELEMMVSATTTPAQS